METSNFASHLQKRSNKITRVLIYAILEWVLISLLLLNSLFSLLIHKFAIFFGLKPPCIFCSRFVYDFQQTQKADIICEQHAVEISKIGYCSQHRKLVESRSLCLDCDCSSGHDHDHDSGVDVERCCCCDGIIKLSHLDRDSDDLVVNQRGEGRLHSDVKSGFEFLDDDGEKDDEKESLLKSEEEVNEESDNNNSQSASGCEVLGDRDVTVLPLQKLVSIDPGNEQEDGDDDDDEKGENDKNLLPRNEEEEEDDNNNSQSVSWCNRVWEDRDVTVLPLQSLVPSDPRNEDEDDISDKKIVVSDGNMNLRLDMLPQHLEFYIDHDDYRLIPVDLVNSKEVFLCDEEDSKEFELLLEGDEVVCGFKFISKENLPSIQEEEEEEEEKDEENMRISHPYEDESMIQETNVATLQEQEEEKMEISQHHQEENKIEERNFANFLDKVDEKMEISHAHEEENNIEEKNLANLLEEAEEKMEVSQPHHEEGESGEMSLSNFEKLEEKNEISQQTHQEESTNYVMSLPTLQEEDEEEKMVISQPHIEENKVEGRSLATLHDQEEKVEISQPHVEESKIEKRSLASSPLDAKQSEEGEIDEKTLKIDLGLFQNELEETNLETPNSVESIHSLQNELPLLGRSESATEESIDVSMISEAECGDVTSTIEKLNSELQVERNTLRSLYKELEEERSASAVSANQTMAMINRLQEEKATMQMEALHYQRMLEEQSEYDQEALQMMNELMVKREREKLDLEKELEVLRKKVLDYDERERVRVLNRRRNSSASCSYGEESDGLSIDLNHEVKDHEENSGGIQEDTPIEAILGLQESLTGFEEERQAILEQLKALEEKLFTLVEEEEEHVENMKPFEQFCEENGKDFDDDNEFSHVNDKHQLETRLNGSMQKRLLPLFDATELTESPDEELEGREQGFDHLESNKSPIMKFELEKKRLALEEEVDLVYERLQALEADREFLKHCIGSLKKGDKGLDLLQEILQHLRDLKSVELQAMKNMDHCASV